MYIRVYKNLRVYKQRTTGSDMNKNTADHMKTVLKSLVDKNYFCITQLFYFGHLPYNENNICSKNFPSSFD